MTAFFSSETIRRKEEGEKEREVEEKHVTTVGTHVID